MFSAWARSMNWPRPVRSRHRSAASTAATALGPVVASIWVTGAISGMSMSGAPRMAWNPDQESTTDPIPPMDLLGPELPNSGMLRLISRGFTARSGASPSPSRSMTPKP
jgi:hypothetical protein